MSGDFLINGLVAVFSAVVMPLSIELAAAAGSATVDTPTQSSRQVIEFDNGVASYRSARDGKQPIGAIQVSTKRDGKPRPFRSRRLPAQLKERD